MALELAGNRIRVNAWRPATSIRDESAISGRRPRANCQTDPQRRVGAGIRLDGAIMLLASNASRYMIGSVVTVDGGFR
jgi:3-oxoacyl-[acyl-carrier protein] reductase